MIVTSTSRNHACPRRAGMSEPGAGMAIHVNGQRICNVDTMFALQRYGLVEQLDGPGPKGKLVGQWKATEEGRALARRLCL